MPGADLVRVAVPREKDADALRTIVAESPIPVIADIHFNHTLALKAIDAGAHCIRLNPGNIGGRDKVAEVALKATEHNVPMRIGVNSGSLPKHLHELERQAPVEALVAAAAEFVELMESPRLHELQGLDQVDERAQHDRREPPARREDPLSDPPRDHRGRDEVVGSPEVLGRASAPCSPTESGTRSGSSLSTFHAEEEVKVAWEILKALQLRERGPVLIACPTCGRLQFDMDTVVAEIEQRLEGYTEPIEVAVLGCAVNGIGEASHADFGITGAKDEGLIFAHGKPLRKIPQEQLVDALFEEIDKSLGRGGEIEVEDAEAAEGAEWLRRIEEENAGDLTPEKIAAMEKAAAERGEDITAPATARRAVPEAGQGQEGRARRGSLADRRPPLHQGLARERNRSCDFSALGGKSHYRCRPRPLNASWSSKRASGSSSCSPRSSRRRAMR